MRKNIGYLVAVSASVTIGVVIGVLVSRYVVSQIPTPTVPALGVSAHYFPQQSNSSAQQNNDGCFVFPPDRGLHQVLVMRVIDGDTVVVGLPVKMQVRLSGINAPEIKLDPDHKGDLAKKRLKALIQGKMCNASFDGRDKYGRTIGWIYLQEDPNKSVASILIEEGLAVPFP